MTKEQGFACADPIDLDPFISSQTRERTLNAAIVQANISETFEEYLEIFDVFYDDNIEVSSDTGEEAIHGKARVRSLLANFLAPLHVMAELHGLLISVRRLRLACNISRSRALFQWGRACCRVSKSLVTSRNHGRWGHCLPTGWLN